MSSEGLDPSKTAALVTWVNSFKVADPVEKLTQLQDGVVLVKIFNKITSNDNEGQQVLEKPPEDRLRYLCSSLEVQCRYNPASGSLISWQNILRQENLERELAKVTVLLFYCSTLKNHSVDCEALDYNTQAELAAILRFVLYSGEELYLKDNLDQFLEGKAVKLSQSSSSFEEYSPVSKPKTEVVRFLDLQKVASTSSMNNYFSSPSSAPPSSPMLEVFLTPQFQVRRLKEQLANERVTRDELEVELAENQKRITEKDLQISAMQQRISRLVSLNEKQSEEGEPKELGELREKNESLMSRLQDALKLCQDLKTDNRQKDRKIDQLTQESGDLSWKVRGFATQVNQSEKTLKELSEEYEAAVDLWNKQRQELEDDLNATLDERKAAEEEVLILQGKIAVLEDQLKNAQEGGSKGEVMGDVLQLDSLKQQVMDLSVKVSNLEEKIKLLEEEKSLCETKLKSETDQFEEDRRQLNSIIENLQQSLSEFKIHKDTLEQMARDQEERLTAQIDTLNVEISKLNASIVEKDEEMLNLQKQVEEEKKQKGLLAEDLSKQEQSTRESIQVLKVQVDDLANKLKEKENSIMQLTKEWETEKASSASQISTMQEACKKSAQEKEAIAHCYEEFKKEKESELKAILQQLTDLKEAGGGNQAVSALQDEKNELLQKVQILDNSVLDLTTKCQNLQAESESHNKIHLEAVELLKTQLKEAENKVKDYEQTLAQRSELAKENMALKQKQDHLAQLLKQTESEIKNETKQVVFFREAHEKAIQEKESAVLQCEELKRSKENELNALSRRMHDLEEKCKKSESIVGVLQDEKKVLSCKVNEQDAAVHNLTTKYKNLETEHKTLVKSHEESLALVKANLQEANKKLKEYEQTIALHAELVKENQGLKQKEETLAQLLKQREAEREDEIKKSAALQEAHKKASLEKEASIKQFEKFKKDKEMEMKKLTEQIQAFEKAQSSNKTAVTDLQKEKNDLQLKIQELETAGHKMKSDYQALQAKMDNELKTHVKEIDLLKKNLQEAEKKVKKYEESISSHADLIKENDSLKQKEERLSKLLKQKETEKEDEVKRASLLQEACSKATQEKETAVAQYSALQREKEKEVKGLYDKIRSLQDAKGNNQAVVTSLQEETKELQQKIQELETTIQGVNSKYQSLQNENNAQTKAHMCTVDSLKASLQEMENRVTEYEQKLSSYSDLVKENDALKQKKDELTKLMKQKDAENEDKLKQISHLQEACEKATKEKVCSVKQSEEFKQTKENELQALSKQIKMMKAEQDTNSSAFTTMQKEKNELLQKLKELDNTVLELNSKYQSLQTENESQNKSHLKAGEMVKLKLQEEESKNKAILEENVRFKEQLTSMEADIGKLRESMETEKKKFSEDRVTDTKKISQMEDELKKAGKLKDQALKELEEERGKRSALEISVKNAEKDFSTKIEKMQESSSSASSKLKEKEAELKNLKAEVSSLRKQCDASRLSETQSNTDLQDQLAKLRESYQQANDQLQAEKGKAVELETRLKALTDEHQKQITTLQTELANTITMLKESESEKQRVVSELGCLQKNLGTASQKETQKASVVEGDAKKSEKQLESLSKELSVERAAKVELETKLRQAVESQEHLASIQSELCNATATLKAKEVEVEKLNSEIKSLQARLEETHGKQKEEVESRRSSLKSDHEKQLAASQKEAQEAKRKLETLTNKYEDAKQKTLDDRQKFQEEKQKLLSQVEKLEKSLTAETKKGEKLEKSMAAEAKKVEELNKKLGQQETTSKTHQQKVKTRENDLKEEIQQKKKQLSELQAQLSQKEKSAEHFKTQMEKVKSHYDAKKEQLDSVQEELNALKKDSTALKSDRDKLDKQLQHMILQAKEVEATNKNLSAKVRTLEVQLEHAERQLHELGKPEIATDALKSRATRRGSRAAEGRADISTDSLELSDIDEPQLNSTRKKNQGISKSMESITSQQLPSKVESLESLYFTPTPSRVHSRLDDSISSSMGDLSVDSSRTTRSTRSRTTQVINITMTKKEPVDTEPDSANSSFLSTQSGHVPKNVKGTRLRSAASASSIASCTSQESLSETQRSISEDHSALLSLPGYHPPTRSSARLSHTGRTSTSSTTSNRKSLSVGTCQDEPDQLDEWNRLAELQRRNKICPPHLKTSYPLESKPPLGIATVTDEEVKTGDPNETLRRASLLPSQVKETSAASQSITTRRQRKRQSEESHHGPDTPESKRSASCFPRPLTPKDKKEGRKLTFDVNLRSDSQSATQPERRQSMAFSILNTPQSIRKSLLSRGKKKETPKQSPRATSSPRVISTKSPHSASIRSPRGTSRTTNTSSASIKKSPRLSASLRKVKEHRLLRRKT